MPARALALTLLCLLALPAAAEARRDVPRGFQWGVAIAGFQTEMGQGRNLDPGSDWWAWTHDATNIANDTVTDDRPEDGPGFLARYRTDIRLAARRLHLDAFRLGIEWSRIFPRSTAGATTLRQLDRLANHRALRRYRRILELIRSRGMEPWVTINHFTLPLWIHDPIAARDAFAGVGPDDPPPTGFGPGGWLDPSTVTEFRKYARYLATKLGGVVDRWITLNEPMVVTVSGYANVPGVVVGNFPPGAYNFPAAIEVIQNLADANAAAYGAVKKADRRARVGVVHNMVAFTPTDPGLAADVLGTEHADYLFNRLFLDAAIKGYRDVNANGIIEPAERDPARAGKADFIGVNYYFRGRVTGLGAPFTPTIPILDFLPSTTYQSAINPMAPPCPTDCTDFGWEIFPDGLRQVLGIAGEYGRPLIVTENGISDANDDQRPGYLRSHLRALRQTIRAREARVRGYFHWSLVDNFEWAAGYTQRFGLFRYDPATLRRTPRPSARLYGRIARTDNLP
jgi:beta-glucosidase/6-phospho-beta-glucosidase/beta-galactosidase